MNLGYNLLMHWDFKMCGFCAMLETVFNKYLQKNKTICKMLMAKCICTPLNRPMYSKTAFLKWQEMIGKGRQCPPTFDHSIL